MLNKLGANHQENVATNKFITLGKTTLKLKISQIMHHFRQNKNQLK